MHNMWPSPPPQPATAQMGYRPCVEAKNKKQAMTYTHVYFTAISWLQQQYTQLDRALCRYAAGWLGGCQRFWEQLWNFQTPKIQHILQYICQCQVCEHWYLYKSCLFICYMTFALTQNKKKTISGLFMTRNYSQLISQTGPINDRWIKSFSLLILSACIVMYIWVGQQRIRTSFLTGVCGWLKAALWIIWNNNVQ